MTWKWAEWFPAAPAPDAGHSVRDSAKAHKDERKIRTAGSDSGVLPSGSGALLTNRDGPDDPESLSLAWVRLANRVFRFEVDPAAGKVEINVVDSTAQASAVQVELDLGAKPEAPAAVAAPAIAPMLARVGDMTGHGTPLSPGIGSADVFADGLPVFRTFVDLHVCPLATPVPHGAGGVLLGAPTVFVNGMQVARAGDLVVEPLGGPNPIVLGCPSVFAGPPAPPMAVPPPEAAEADKPWWDILEFEVLEPIRADGLFVEAGAKAGAEGDLEEGQGWLRIKAELQAQLVRVSGGARLSIELPFTDAKFSLNYRGSIGLGCVGGEAKASVAVKGKGATGSSTIPFVGPRPVCGDGEAGWSLD
jgi:uncharacterized Zn-binding protein involved in type VI secretion